MDYFTNDRIVKPQRGDLLISEPYLPDPNFERTVIYLCEHDENGSLGFVINKPAENKLSDLLDVGSVDSHIFVGGPVQQDTLHFLHKDSISVENGKPIRNGVCWGIDFEGLIGSMENRIVDPMDVRFFVGYSGWSPGQLMEEVEAHSWIVYQGAGQDLVFDTRPENLWKKVLQLMGGKFRLISNYPLDPRLN